MIQGRERWWERRYSRRGALRTGGAGTAGLLASALIGCGEDEPAPVSATGTPAPSGTTTAASPTPAPQSGEVKRGGTWRTAATGDPPTLDPYASGSAWTKGAAAYAYSRLYRVDAQEGLPANLAVVEPDLAESAETEDGQTWIVKLKPGVKFQNIDPLNGRELTAADVTFSWSRLTAEASVNAAAVANVVGVEEVDERTLRFQMTAPSPIFLEQLADGNLLWVMPTESDGDFQPTIQPIGTGPWIMQDYLASSRINFVRNPDYYDPELPIMDAVDQFIIPEYGNAKAQFESGSIHALTIVADDVLDLQSRHPEVNWSGELTAGVWYYFFSAADLDPDAPWQDERFRQAASMAIDREAMLDIGYNVPRLRAAGLDASEAWNNIVGASSGERWWLDPQSEAQGESAKFFQYDPAEARRLLDAMGREIDEVKWQYAGERYGSVFKIFAEATERWFNEAGIPARTEVQDYNSVYFPQTRAGNFTGIAYGVTPAYPEVDGYINRYFSESDSNASRIRDPLIVDLYEKSRIEMDEATRREQIFDIQRRNAEMMYYVPTNGGAGTTWTAYQPEVRGIRLTRGYGGPTEVTARLWLDQ